MKQNVLYTFLAIFVLLSAFYVWGTQSSNNGEKIRGDYKNIEYKIGGKAIKLTDGFSEVEAAPGSASKIITRYFGNEAVGDLNGDGEDDVAFLLTQESGGSGTFFYIVGAVKTESGYSGTDAVFLGDRIAPQSTEIKDGEVIVNYADRAPGEDFSTLPSVGKSLWLKLDPQTMRFGEVVKDFEGEADPSVMKLNMKSWVWISANYQDGRKIEPNQPGKFTLTFSPEGKESKGGKFSAATDCNSVGGDYLVAEDSISFSQIVSTLMFCENSKESEFVSFLENARSYQFTSRGELILELESDSGEVVFR